MDETKKYVGVTRKAREQIANLLHAGSIPVTYSKICRIKIKFEIYTTGVVEIQQYWLTMIHGCVILHL